MTVPSFVTAVTADQIHLPAVPVTTARRAGVPYGRRVIGHHVTIAGRHIVRFAPGVVVARSDAPRLLAVHDEAVKREAETAATTKRQREAVIADSVMIRKWWPVKIPLTVDQAVRHLTTVRPRYAPRRSVAAVAAEATTPIQAAVIAATYPGVDAVLGGYPGIRARFNSLRHDFYVLSLIGTDDQILARLLDAGHMPPAWIRALPAAQEIANKRAARHLRKLPSGKLGVSFLLACRRLFPSLPDSAAVLVARHASQMPIGNLDLDVSVVVAVRAWEATRSGVRAGRRPVPPPPPGTYRPAASRVM